MSNRINFTKRGLNAIKPPDKGRDTYYDTMTRGLMLLVTSKGSKSFYVYRRVQGRPTKIKIGNFPDLTVEQARKAAEKTNGQIAQNATAHQLRNSKRGEWTLGQLYEHWFDNYSKPRKRTWRIDESRWRIGSDRRTERTGFPLVLYWRRKRLAGCSGLVVYPKERHLLTGCITSRVNQQ